jgi:hypothetical protein
VSTGAGPVPLAHLEMAVADRVSDVQARAIWHAVTEARAGKFDVLAVYAGLVAAGYTPLKADTLVQEVIERMAEN